MSDTAAELARHITRSASPSTPAPLQSAAARALARHIAWARPAPSPAAVTPSWWSRFDVAKATKSERGPRGPRGEPGPQGEMGPMPHHQWIEGTKLQFEKPDGSWGQAVDLKGERGLPGGVGVIQMPGAGTTGNGYFPAGW